MTEIQIKPCCIESILSAYAVQVYTMTCECGQEIKIVDPSLKHRSCLGFLGVPLSLNQHQPVYEEFP